MDNKIQQLSNIIYSTKNLATETVWGNNFSNIISDSSWLKHKNFAPGRWAMGYPALYTLYRILNEAKPSRILELGLGQSTRMIGQYAYHFKNITHIIVEHDTKWIDFFKKDFILSNNSNIVNLDLTMTNYKDENTVRTFYRFKENFNNKKFDFICIDAPYGYDMKKYSRIDILQILPDCLDENFIIMIDDTNRTGENNTIKEICSILETHSIEYHIGNYEGCKKSSVICSSTMKFFSSL